MGIKGFFSKEDVVVDDRTEGQKPASKQKKVLSCKDCLLCKQCNSDRMQPHGRFKKEAMVWAEQPGNVEDEEGKQLVGPSGQRIRDTLEEFDIDLDRDCVKTNSLDCWKKNGKPTLATVTDGEWRTNNAVMELLLLGITAERIEEGGDYQPFPDLAIAEMAVSELGAEIIKVTDVPKFVTDRVY